MGNLILYKVANGYVLELPTEPCQHKDLDSMWVFKDLNSMNSWLHSYYNDDGLNND